MRLLKAIAPLLCFLLFAPMMATTARADEYNKKTIFTFSAPFEIPGFNGPMVLPAGTYVFKLLDTMANRNIVQVFNKNETHLYSTILAIPDYRLQPSDKTIVKFTERASNSPEALKAWFYPGDSYGQEFVYPKVRAVELAKNANEPVLSMPEETSANMAKPIKSGNEAAVKALEQANVKAEKPNGAEEEMAQVVTTKPPAGESTTEANNNTATELPKTASTMPLWGLAGLLLCCAGAGLRIFSKRTV